LARQDEQGKRPDDRLVKGAGAVDGDAWERVARSQAYWGVLSHERFKSERLDDAARSEFWASGEQYVDRIIDYMRQKVLGDFSPSISLDFGCGVGRLLYPLSKVSQRAIGVDISPTMLEYARANLEEQGVANCLLVRSIEDPAVQSQPYDFVHSALVFQHIRPSDGYRILRQLVSRLESSGFGALHFRCRASFSFGQIPRYVRARSRMLGRVAAVLRRKPQAAAFIEIHEYDVGRILAVLHSEGVHEVAALTSIDQGRNVTFFFRKTP
jgi:SAM-dependent methyltransferase